MQVCLFLKTGLVFSPVTQTNFLHGQLQVGVGDTSSEETFWLIPLFYSPVLTSHRCSHFNIRSWYRKWQLKRVMTYLHYTVKPQLTQLSWLAAGITAKLKGLGWTALDIMIKTNVKILPVEFEGESTRLRGAIWQSKRNNTFTLDGHRRHFVTKLHLFPDLRS